MAKEKIYVGAVGTEIILDAGQDITGATVSIEVIKPGGTTATWGATVCNSRYVRHVSISGDFDVAGEYRVQPHITLLDGSWYGLGKTGAFQVYSEFE